MKHCKNCGKLLLHISWSRLLVHAECRAKNKLYSKHKSPGRDLRNFFHGSVADKCMMAWLSNDPEQTPGGMLNLVNEIADSIEKEAEENKDGIIKWRHLSDRKDLLVYCKEVVTRLEPILNELVLPYEYEPARRFKVPITIPYLDGTPAQITLVGETDIITRDENKDFSVWDLKATKDDSYWRKTWGQLVFYDIAMGAEFGQYCKETGLIQPMCKEQVLRFNITQKDRDALMAKIIDMAHSMWKKDYEPKRDSAGCSYCLVRASCGKWSPIGDPVTRRIKMANLVVGAPGGPALNVVD